MTGVGLAVLVFTLIAASIYLRMRHYRSSLGDMEPKASPLSVAVQDMVGTAGGVYLSLVMLVSFLKIDLPGRVYLLGIGVDPTALLAIALAVVQPLLYRFRKK